MPDDARPWLASYQPDVPAAEQADAQEANGTAPGKTVLATSVVGSYSVPEWLERLKTDFYQRRISGQYLDDIHEVAIKAALNSLSLFLLASCTRFESLFCNARASSI